MCNFRALPLEQVYNVSDQSAHRLVIGGYAGAVMSHRSPVTDFLWQGDFFLIHIVIFILPRDIHSTSLGGNFYMLHVFNQYTQYIF